MRALRHPLSLAAVVVIGLAVLSTAASAHVGDHSHMSFAEMANHLLSSLDHELTIVAVVLILALAGSSALPSRRKGRNRSPETPAT